MKLIDLVKDVDYELVQGDLNYEIKDIVYDSRKANKDTVFVAMKGFRVDGHDYISNANSISKMKSMPDNCVDLVIADPPYNLSKSGNWKCDNSISLEGMGGNWNITNENWDNMSLNDYLSFTIAWLSEAKRILKPTGSMWIFGTYHNIGIICGRASFKL